MIRSRQLGLQPFRDVVVGELQVRLAILRVVRRRKAQGHVTGLRHLLRVQVLRGRKIALLRHLIRRGQRRQQELLRLDIERGIAMGDREARVAVVAALP